MRVGCRVLLIWLSVFAAVQAHEPQPVYDRVSLSVDAETEVENDLLVAVLYTEHQGQRQTEVAERVNDAMRWALGQAKTAGDLKVQTLQYTTSPVYRNKVISGWRARQSLRLESRDAGALSEMIGALQERLSVQSINYSISRTARSEAEHGLISEALTRFKQRAQQVTQQMNRDGYRLVQINISTSGQRPPPVAYNARLQMAEAQAAPPALEAGLQTVTVNVSGTIELDPPR